jgi:catechol 2,3-dioxygenase-like lactoylglutathione lyase family enzyme
MGKGRNPHKNWVLGCEDKQVATAFSFMRCSSQERASGSRYYFKQKAKAGKTFGARELILGFRDTHRNFTSMEKSKLLQMHNVGIVVESLDNAIAFFTELGLKLEGRAMVEGEWAGRVTGLGNQSVEIAMMVTPDGHSRLELSRFLAPATIADHRAAPVNALGYLRLMFAVENIDELVARLVQQGAELVGEVVNYENIYRLCYIRGVEGLLIGLAEQLGSKTATDILEDS